MGSACQLPELPDSNSQSLVLTHPTTLERRRTWALHYSMWGPALSEEDYVAREAYLVTVPLAREDGLRPWILTVPDDGEGDNGSRPVLSSCETLRKRAIVSRGGSEIEEGVAHGVVNVFTDPAMRGQGYARRMMDELGRRLAGWQESNAVRNGEGGRKGAKVLFSVLFSDIGKTFYAKVGWTPFPSSHLSFPATTAVVPVQNGSGPVGGVTPLTAADLPSLCEADEALLRVEVRSRAAATGRTTVALLPDLDTMHWHLLREDFMTRHILGRTPQVRGALFGELGRRMWAVWTRGYYGGAGKTEGNTLHVLRFVVEDGAEGRGEEYLAEGFRGIVRLAIAEAREWMAANVHIWNPGPVLRRAAEGAGLGVVFVEREKDSIASLRWFGEDKDEVEWIANEKFGWC